MRISDWSSDVCSSDLIHQIPAIGLKLVAHRCRKACRAYHADLFVTSDIDPQQLVEPDEMIHVHMGNEDVSYTQQVSRAERREIAQIEQQCLRPVESLNEQSRVAEAAVYQRGMQRRTQGYLFVRPSRGRKSTRLNSSHSCA